MIPCFFYGAEEPPHFPGEKVGEALLYGFTLQKDGRRISLQENEEGVVPGSVYMMSESGWDSLGGERTEVTLEFWGEVLRADTLSYFAT